MYIDMYSVIIFEEMNQNNAGCELFVSHKRSRARRNLQNRCFRVCDCQNTTRPSKVGMRSSRATQTALGRRAPQSSSGSLMYRTSDVKALLGVSAMCQGSDGEGAAPV